MKVLFLSRYGNLGASSRYRAYQYLPYLRQHGFDIIVAPLLDDHYIKDLYAGYRKNVSKILEAYIMRKKHILQAKDYDLIWIEKEALPWVPHFVEYGLGLHKTPYVVDYDDAVFHRYDKHNMKLIRMLLGSKIDQVMKKSALVVAGNDYLADRAQKAGAPRIEVLPTVLDLKKYNKTPQPDNNPFTIGWIGSPATSRYLTHIAPALEYICKQGGSRVVLVGAGKVDLPDIPIQHVEWSEDTEVKEIQRFDVGIMPLPDDPWERGKCGFKLIQYMACVRPVVGSPVGVNSKIIQCGVNGYQASTNSEWIKALLLLKQNKDDRKRMGEVGRMLVENEYSLEIAAPRLVKMLLSVKHCVTNK
jgi:glycosyltransferase involved in cell wall biosynthesis